VRYIEFQLTATKFADMFRQSLRALDLSTPSSLTSGPFEVLLDQVEVGSTAVWAGEPTTHTVVWEDGFGQEQHTWVDATSTGIAQDLILHSTLLTGRGSQDPQLNGLPGIPASVVMLLSGRRDREGKPAVYLTPTYVTVSLPALPGVSDWDRQYIQSVMETRIRSLMSERLIPMPIEKLRRLGLTIVDVGVATDPARTRLAIRFQSLPRPEPIRLGRRSRREHGLGDDPVGCR
jgi:hypothetical protein